MRSTTTAPFETARLSLSLVQETDRDDLIALERDPEVMRFLNGGRPTPDDGEAGRSFLTPRGGENYVWAARETRSGAFLGWFSLRPVDEGVAELGYRLRREAWVGLRLRGRRGARRPRIRRHGLQRIVATAMTVHAASRRVLEKAGLAYARTVYPDEGDPFPGSELGDVEYEITRAEWERLASRD